MSANHFSASLFAHSLCATSVAALSQLTIFRKFDADGSGELDSGELQKVIVTILETLRNKACAAIMRKNKPGAGAEQKQVKENYAKLIAHYKSPRGSTEILAIFDPGAIFCPGAMF